MTIIELNNLTKYFKVLKRREGLIGTIKDLFKPKHEVVKAVDNISMKIDQGEIVGFVGPNGAGKSTTIKMLIGVLKPTSGDLAIYNYLPYKQRKDYVKNIGVVIGNRTMLWWDLAVIESFKLLKEIYQISDKDYEQNLEIYNQFFNLSALYSTPVRKLSLGQKMLCEIAAAFLHNPKLIFLDEPTIGLDVAVKEKVRKLIIDLNKIKKTTILLTTHDIGDIEELCKRIILIDNGKLIYDGDIKKFNLIFGAYRTLTLELGEIDDIPIESINEEISDTFKPIEPIILKKKEEIWLTLTINQDDTKLIDILNFLMKKFSVKDIKIEEVELERVIKEVYAGGLK
ncbi:MAG: ATP-binding cassette domain-containing protein [Candidatus Lokiarchaeota archaeon]|nr:ATP-binding cassette domain-containing protein [Candidatus Lokiarchaeota archaeon]